MKAVFGLMVVALLTLFGLGLAADRSGVWEAKGVDRTVRLNLSINGNEVTGTLEGLQGVMTVQAALQGDTAEGTVTNENGSAYLKIVFSEPTLALTLANFDANGRADPATAVNISLKRPEGPKEETTFYISGFAAPLSDPLLGAWVSGTLRLELKGGNGKYTGRIVIGKDAAAITATGNAKSLKGSFKQGKALKSFAANLDKNDHLRFVLANKTYSLARVR